MPFLLLSKGKVVLTADFPRLLFTVVLITLGYLVILPLFFTVQSSLYVARGFEAPTLSLKYYQDILSTPGTNIFTAKQKGAPVEWRPVDPVIASVGHSALPVKAPHPHAALLFLDYLHSKEGQQFGMKGGFSSPREDVGSLEQKFKKVYLENKYSFEELEKKLNDWEILMRQLFMRKR